MTKNFPLLLILSLITCCIEIDMSVPSFPEISDYFDISDGWTQMIVAINFFGFCLSSIICGPLSDAYGRRSVMIIGNAVMLIGAAGCTIAPNFESLLFARFIQGLGASTSCVVVFAMIADVYAASQAAKLIGQMNSVISLFMTIAPMIGAFINSALGFRGNFSVLALVSLISWLMLYWYLPETNKNMEKFNSKTMIKNFYILMTDKSFIYASLAPSLMYAGYLSFITCMPFLYMETYDLSIMYYALHQGLIIFTFSVVSMNFSKITNVFSEKKCIIYATITNVVGGSITLIMGVFTPDSPILCTIAMMIYTIGAAVSYPIIFAKSLDIFPNIKGTASSTLMAMRALLLGTFIAFAAYIYNGTLLNVAFVLLIASLLVMIFTFRLLKLISFDTKG
jgi:DHA1 family bicyclomycin/chloramphenicol resistance-like MFS transporter